MIIHLCDVCGKESNRGVTSSTPAFVTPEKQTKRHKKTGHTASRSVTVYVGFGIDGIVNPFVSSDRPTRRSDLFAVNLSRHTLCLDCQISALKDVLSVLESEQREDVE